MPHPFIFTHRSVTKQAPSSSLLAVNCLHTLASTSSTNRGQTFAHRHLQHVEMSSVQDPSLKGGGAGGSPRISRGLTQRESGQKSLAEL